MEGLQVTCSGSRAEGQVGEEENTGSKSCRHWSFLKPWAAPATWAGWRKKGPTLKSSADAPLNIHSALNIQTALLVGDLWKEPAVNELLGRGLCLLMQLFCSRALPCLTSPRWIRQGMWALHHTSSFQHLLSLFVYYFFFSPVTFEIVILAR